MDALSAVGTGAGIAIAGHYVSQKAEKEDELFVKAVGLTTATIGFIFMLSGIRSAIKVV